MEQPRSSVALRVLVGVGGPCSLLPAGIKASAQNLYSFNTLWDHAHVVSRTLSTLPSLAFVFFSFEFSPAEVRSQKGGSKPLLWFDNSLSQWERSVCAVVGRSEEIPAGQMSLPCFLGKQLFLLFRCVPSIGTAYGSDKFSFDTRSSEA